MTGLKRGVVIDVETTGLDQKNDVIIQLAILPFAFDGRGRWSAGTPFVGLEDPLQPIPAKVVRLTGLTDEAVFGLRLNDAEVEAAVGDPAIVIAHHAEFDRKFLERRFRFSSISRLLHDAGSMGRAGFGAKLAYLMMGAGLFHDAHDAAGDCAASRAAFAPFAGGRGTALSHVLAAAAILLIASGPSER